MMKFGRMLPQHGSSLLMDSVMKMAMEFQTPRMLAQVTTILMILMMMEPHLDVMMMMMAMEHQISMICVPILLKGKKPILRVVLRVRSTVTVMGSLTI